VLKFLVIAPPSILDVPRGVGGHRRRPCDAR